MAYAYKLTWMPHAKRWRKRYLGKTYYMRSQANGKRDRTGYENALREWERLKAYIDGLGPSPYTTTGALVPEEQVFNAAPTYIPPAPVRATTAAVRTPAAARNTSKGASPAASRSADDPAWIVSTGIGPFLNPELVVSDENNPYAGELRIEALANFWHEQRKLQTEQEELSLKQWSEDTAKLKTFRDFLRVNYPQTIYVDEITAAMLNLYRDKQWSFLDSGDEHQIGKATLKKRLDTVRKWLKWLVDQNILDDLPKDLSSYSRVKRDKPKPLFWTTEEIKLLLSKASQRTRLYIMLGLNLGYTQRDIATLEANMIAWQTGIVTRDRQKSGVPSKAKLWPSTLELMQKHRSHKSSGPLLLDRNGMSLYRENINDNGKLVTNDCVSFAFNRLKATKKAGLKNDKRGFKHFRKSAANEIERVRPDLTELFLAHAEKGMKRHYVQAAYAALFQATDELEKLYVI
ncbi:hypothetical protein [Aeoliella mucimassa]|uniref:Tyrosine recombinase XerC n=1 Tax=Aeoliella mucimassa TaxID=2527972 RepID=A0A518ALL0_9BACT|nr:hypothetical protein [Aeoliella mucimassa]QDU55618.1 Tyrosine recombinase XerC [Aeoliella mucimassa]